jgi:hypothetical protein
MEGREAAMESASHDWPAILHTLLNLENGVAASEFKKCLRLSLIT